MRDRLIELLKDVKFNPFDQFNIERNLNRIIDVILSDGWFRPPCKEGDTVYCVWKYEDWFGKVDGPFIEEDVCQGFLIDMGQIKILPVNYGKRADSFYRLLDCCLTKEEAEKALSKLQANNRQVKEGEQG